MQDYRARQDILFFYKVDLFLGFVLSSAPPIPLSFCLIYENDGFSWVLDEHDGNGIYPTIFRSLSYSQWLDMW